MEKAKRTGKKDDTARTITDKSCSMIFPPDNLLDYIFLENRTLLYYSVMSIGGSQETHTE